MHENWRLRASPKRLELHFPVGYQTVPHAEENLLFVQTQCRALCKRLITTFSLSDKTVTVSFCAALTPQLQRMLERVASFTERILLSQEQIVLYIKYFADPSPRERAISVLFSRG